MLQQEPHHVKIAPRAGHVEGGELVCLVRPKQQSPGMTQEQFRHGNVTAATGTQQRGVPRGKTGEGLVGRLGEKVLHNSNGTCIAGSANKNQLIKKKKKKQEGAESCAEACFCTGEHILMQTYSHISGSIIFHVTSTHNTCHTHTPHTHTHTHATYTHTHATYTHTCHIHTHTCHIHTHTCHIHIHTQIIQTSSSIYTDNSTAPKMNTAVVIEDNGQLLVPLKDNAAGTPQRQCSWYPSKAMQLVPLKDNAAGTPQRLVHPPGEQSQWVEVCSPSGEV